MLYKLISCDFHDIVCQKLWTSLHADLIVEENLTSDIFETYGSCPLLSAHHNECSRFFSVMSMNLGLIFAFLYSLIHSFQEIYFQIFYESREK